MNSSLNGSLARFYRFFEKSGNERLSGLDESYFVGLTESEKEEAWNFLKNGFASSAERIAGLYILDKDRAIALFKTAISSPVETTPYSAVRQELESARLLMLSYINSAEPDERYVAAMCEFANSDFKDVRAEFAQSLPISKTTPDAVDALKKMIFTETERIPLTSAITKLMVIHGLDYEIEDPLYDSVYLSLRSDNPKEKLAAMNSLERMQKPNYYRS